MSSLRATRAPEAGGRPVIRQCADDDRAARFRVADRRMRTAGYVAGLLAGTAVVAVLMVVLLDDGAPEDVSLPPIRETQLVDAARQAGCELRRARPRERTDPAVRS